MREVVNGSVRSAVPSALFMVKVFISRRKQIVADQQDIRVPGRRADFLCVLGGCPPSILGWIVDPPLRLGRPPADGFVEVAPEDAAFKIRAQRIPVLSNHPKALRRFDIDADGGVLALIDGPIEWL